MVEVICIVLGLTVGLSAAPQSHEKLKEHSARIQKEHAEQSQGG